MQPVGCISSSSLASALANLQSLALLDIWGKLTTDNSGIGVLTDVISDKLSLTELKLPFESAFMKLSQSAKNKITALTVDFESDSHARDFVLFIKDLPNLSSLFVIHFRERDTTCVLSAKSMGAFLRTIGKLHQIKIIELLEWNGTHQHQNDSDLGDDIGGQIADAIALSQWDLKQLKRLVIDSGTEFVHTVKLAIPAFCRFKDLEELIIGDYIDHDAMDLLIAALKDAPFQVRQI